MIVALIAGLFTFLFGGMLLILVLGASRIEAELTERAEAEARDRRAQATHVPRFFFLTSPPAPSVPRVDEALLMQLQRYVEREQMLADEFVMRPSLESLYHQSEWRLTRH